MANDRVAYFKTLRLGDIARGPEALSVIGEDPQVVSTLGATKPVVIEAGGRSGYEHVVTAHLIRHFTATETQDAFFVRKLAFMTALRGVMGWGTGYSSAGILAISSSTGSNFHTTTGAATAGTNVNIPISGVNITVTQVEGWYITDGVSYESFVPNIGAWTNGIQAATLANSYLSGATIFRPLWGLPTARLLHGVKLEANEPSVNQVSKNIELRFLCVDDPAVNPLI